MKRHFFFLIAYLAPLLTCGSVVAQEADARRIIVDSLHTGVVGNRFHLSMTLRLDSLQLGANRRIVYTPLLTGKGDGGDTADTLSFPEIRINGRRQHIAHQRNAKGFGGVEKERRNHTAQTVSYEASVPYSPWMDYATLYLTDDLCGCGNLLERTRSLLAAIDHRPKEEALPHLHCFVTPQAEARKERSEKGSAFIDFPVNRTEIHTDYRCNRAELDKIIATIDLVRNDPNVEINTISIHGYASPEGSYANNDRLASGRARTLAQYVAALYHFPDSMLTVASTAEDWDGLRRHLADTATTLPHKEALLAIARNTSLAPDARDRKLKSDYPAQYAHLLKEVYPALRHSDYEVSYTVRAFSLEEAREVFRTKPRQLSLQEMYLVAQSYPAGSDEFNKVFEVAVRLFPDDPVANLNAAVNAVNRGEADKALRYLDKAGDLPQTDEVRRAARLLQNQTAKP